MKRPNDIMPTLLWYDTSTETTFGCAAVINPERHQEECDIFWGSHGCHRPQGHDGPHWCDCCDCADHPERHGQQSIGALAVNFYEGALAEAPNRRVAFWATVAALVAALKSNEDSIEGAA